MKAIIAEKPSVAYELARIVGATEKRDGYFEGGGFLVTWAYGHFVGLAMPEDYGIRGFSRESLPIIPEDFLLVGRKVKTGSSYIPDEGSRRQLEVIKRVFSHCDRIIVATDLEQRDGRAVRKGNDIAKFFAGNKVDVFIYAVEKSLDAYKINTLANKQRFIGQLKSNSLSVRSIGEGGMDEVSGINFAEYVALLSGNTDLLEKAKIEKKISALESEKHAYMRSKWSSLAKLETLENELSSKKNRLKRLETDNKNFQSRLQRAKDGSILNPVLLDGLSKDAGVKEIGAKLNHLAVVSSTGGEYAEIGSLYGFQILVKTELREKENIIQRENRFFTCGEGNLKYTHNNGIIATDAERASLNFLNALQKLPGIIADEEKNVNKLKTIRLF